MNKNKKIVSLLISLFYFCSIFSILTISNDYNINSNSKLMHYTKWDDNFIKLIVNELKELEKPDFLNTQYNSSACKFDQVAINKWKESIKNADQNDNGLDDQFEKKLDSLSRFFVLENNNNQGKIMLAQNDIINGFFGENIKKLENLSYDHIPIIVQFPDGDFNPICSLFKNLGGEIKSEYKVAIYGFAGIIDYKGLMQFYDTLNSVNKPYFIEEDSIIQANLYYNSLNMNLRPYVWNTLSYDGDSLSSIAVIDTGIDDSHNFFQPGYSNQNYNYKIVGWRDEVNGITSPYDDDGHGSHCAGIAAGKGSPAKDGNGRTVATYSEGYDYTGYYIYPGTSYSNVARFNVTEPGIVEVQCSFNDYTPAPDHVYYSAYLYHNNTIMDSYTVLSTLWSDTLSYTATSSTLGDYYLRIRRTYSDGSGDGRVSNPHIRFRGNIHWPFNPPLIGSGDPWKGVAPDTHLVGVKVLDSTGSGYTSDIVDGINWVISNKMIYNITTISLSLGGSAGQTSLINAVNNAVDNGIVTVVAAGNDGAPGNNIGSPGDADKVITVAAMSYADRVTEYSSSGGSSYTGQTIKPDIMAPGGSEYNFSIFSVDTNDNDASGQYSTDYFLNDLCPMMGTSMATPAVAGAANLLIEAMGGRRNWNYSGEEARRVKALLLMTATETYPLTREIDTSYSPLLNRGGKDIHEGYGRINIDAALEAYTQKLNKGTYKTAWLASSFIDPINKHALGCYVDLIGGEPYLFELTVPEGADFDIYLYSNSPNSKGDPVMVASGTSSGLGVSEDLHFTPGTSGRYYLIVKAISGKGYANIVYPNTITATQPIIPLIGPIPSNPFIVIITIIIIGAVGAAASILVYKFEISPGKIVPKAKPKIIKPKLETAKIEMHVKKISELSSIIAKDMTFEQKLISLRENKVTIDLISAIGDYELKEYFNKNFMTVSPKIKENIMKMDISMEERIEILENFKNLSEKYQKEFINDLDLVTGIPSMISPTTVSKEQPIEKTREIQKNSPNLQHSITSSSEFNSLTKNLRKIELETAKIEMHGKKISELGFIITKDMTFEQKLISLRENKITIDSISAIDDYELKEYFTKNFMMVSPKIKEKIMKMDISMEEKMEILENFRNLSEKYQKEFINDLDLITDSFHDITDHS